MYLPHIASPDDVKALKLDELPALCAEIRRTMLENMAAVGGHVAPNLGVIELTCALHRVFSSPRDKIIFDVSHQSYTHKMLTGRAEAFCDPARYLEVSGFSNPQESEHDLFAMGHTSTSIGLALGLAYARDLADETHDVVAVIGDGSLSGGLALEGLDSDNDQSIAENHGGLYRNLARLRDSLGQAPDNFFRALGLDYRYLDEGNDVLALVSVLEELRGCDHPVVLHIRTVKGLGFPPAEADPEGWHHVGPFDLATGERSARRAADTDYAELTAACLIPAMERDPGVVAVCAATPYIMGFTPERRERAGRQFVDVGIAEEHAVTFATSLAAGGAKPVLGIYGTFLQRAYDELWHDLCLNGAPATVLVYGSSVYGTTDQTHLGYFDIAMLGDMPGLRYLAPTGPEEFCAMLAWSLEQREMPVAIRVPVVGAPAGDAGAPLVDHDCASAAYQVVRRGSDVAVLALGDFFHLGVQVADELERRRGIRPTLVNPRFITELDRDFLRELALTHRLVVTIEDGVLEGGWGEKVARFMGPLGIRVRCHGVHAGFPDRYDPAELLARNDMTVEAMVDDTLALLR